MDVCIESAAARGWEGLSEVEPVVRGWLWRRCRDQSDVDDVVQDTLLRAARYRVGLARPERLASWALSIAANTLRDRMRAGPRWVVAEGGDFDLDQLACVEGCGEPRGGDALLTIGGRRVSRSDALEHLRVALRTLKPRDAALLMDYYGGADVQTLMARTGLGASAVKCRLHRGRRRLARELELRLRLASGAAGASAMAASPMAASPTAASATAAKGAKT